MHDSRPARLFCFRVGRRLAALRQRPFSGDAAVGVVAAAATGAAAAVVTSLLAPPAPLLIWNISASAPVGLYGVGGALADM